MSTRLAICSGNHPQLTSSLSVLVPGLYQKFDHAAESSTTPDVAGLEEDLRGLAVDDRAVRASGRIGNDNRLYFASLLLLYQIAHQDSKASFWRLYFRLRNAGWISAHSGNNNVEFALQAYKAIATPSPLVYHALLRRDDIGVEQKSIVRMVEDRMRKAIWGTMKAGWSTGIPMGFAGRLLGSWENEPAVLTKTAEDGDDWDGLGSRERLEAVGEAEIRNRVNALREFVVAQGGSVVANRIAFK